MPLLSRWPVAAALLVWAHAAVLAQNAIDWHEYYEDAVEEAQQSGKPLFVAFRCVP